MNENNDQASILFLERNIEKSLKGWEDERKDGS
jgi:hypothetical protein